MHSKPREAGREHPTHGSQRRVAVEEFEVAGELLHTIDFTTALDLNGDGTAVYGPAQQVDRADRGRILAPDEGQTALDRIRARRQQFLEIGKLFRQQCEGQ